MTRLFFLLDDAQQCRTQQAVLSAFAAELGERALGEVVFASRLTGLPHWSDVSSESSARLAVRLHALQPAADSCTVFLPGHIVPGPIVSTSRWDGALATRDFSTVADLDLFAIDNAHPDVRRMHDLSVAHPDYEVISRYAAFSTTDLPEWLVSGSLTSALQLTQRPWYFAFAPTRLQWLGWVKIALEREFLTLSMVEEDVGEAWVRPSLLDDVKALRLGIAAPPMPDLTLDSDFIPPEHRLTPCQYRLLHSSELQKRIVLYRKRSKPIKPLNKNLFDVFLKAPQGKFWKLTGFKFLKNRIGALKRLFWRCISSVKLLFSRGVCFATKRLRQPSGDGE